VILALFSVILNALAQVTIKSLTALNVSNPVDLLRHWQLYCTGLLYCASIVTWFIALKGVPLSTAYPLQALGYVLVTVLAYFTFHESVGAAQIGGLALIVSGVTVLAWGAGR